MGPLGQLSPIGQAQKFVINRYHLPNDSYTYIYPANRGRTVFQQTNISQLHKILIFSFISQNGPFRANYPLFAGPKPSLSTEIIYLITVIAI